MAASALALGVCMVLAAAPQVSPRFIPVTKFTLAWTHSIEKVRWEEDYQIKPGPPGKGPLLIAGKARIRGSAAGMEPPDDAVLKDGWYSYQPHPVVVQQPQRLTRSIYTADYDWCMQGHCVPLSAIMPTDGDITLMYACQDPRAGDSPK
jgi:hypothetical protein